MRLDLAERLRCPRAHAPTPLIVVALRVEGRLLRDGIAGCAVCHLEARIADGAVVFPDAAATASPLPLEPTAARVGRTAALLGLDEPGGTVLLTGRYTALATALSAAYGVAVVVQGGDALHGEPAADVFTLRAPAGSVPFADHTFRAAALDGPSDDAVRTVSLGGRILAPLANSTPAGLKELARDSEEWLAEREPPAARVELKRSR